MILEANKTEQLTDAQTNGSLSRSESGSTNADEIVISLTGDVEVDSVKDLQEQVLCLLSYSSPLHCPIFR